MKIKVKKFQSEGFYLLRSQATANSLYFEFQHDHVLFFQLLNRYLSEFIEVVHYHVTPHEWSIIFRTKDADTITKKYKLWRQKSKKAKAEFEKKEVSGMLSEHFRFFISAYVKQSNALNSRNGSKVHSRMEKFIFPSEHILQEEIAKIESGVSHSTQSEERYQPDLGNYEAGKELKAKDLLRSAAACYGVKRLVNTVVVGFVMLLDNIDVVRKILSSTWHKHFGPNPPPFYTPQLE